ncbi:hypothetical protein Cadr_000018468 [Camelus dromedarius]|uniref:Uncharacterized protein n=1 Tax=Camelus dromedarius TaxID=9838 RepID=A0A5N4D262_CAMDR|nr:hypothetical protein Cadr_000018468 [Camelus dromedarius]
MSEKRFPDCETPKGSRLAGSSQTQWVARQWGDALRQRQSRDRGPASFHPSSRPGPDTACICATRDTEGEVTPQLPGSCVLPQGDGQWAEKGLAVGSGPPHGWARLCRGPACVLADPALGCSGLWGTEKWPLQ